MNRIAIPLAVVLGLVLVIAGFWWITHLRDLATRVESFLPPDRGLAKHPEKIEEKVQIRVVIRRSKEEELPHFFLSGEEIAGDPGAGLRTVLEEIRTRVDALLASDPTLPLQIEAGPLIRHEHVISVLDAFLEVCNRRNIANPEITFVGTPLPRPR